MHYRTLDDINVSGKCVLVRSDLNSEVRNRKVVPGERIGASTITIKELQSKRARVVVIAHQGRKGKSDFTDLKQHARLLNKFVHVRFVNDVIGKKALHAIKNLQAREVLLLDNVRFVKDEFSSRKDNKLVRVLAPLFDYYVNDAFSVCHRRHASIVGFPKVLSSCVGRLTEKELRSLDKLKMKDCLYILGGSKAEDNISLLEKEKVITCGIFGQLCLIAKKYNLGAQNKFLKKELKIVPTLRKNGVEGVVTPLDLAIKVNRRRQDLKVEEFPSRYEIFDIGPETQDIYAKIILDAKKIFMKGTAGYCEEKQFCKGTKIILEAIAASKAFSVLGGGHLSSAVKKLKINKNKFGYISLSGGATAWYLAGKKLPGLEALRGN